jgi:hypothetical protein
VATLHEKGYFVDPMRASLLVRAGVLLLGHVALASALGCAGSAAMRAAERGDMAALRGEIGARERAGNLTNGDAAGLASVIASREVQSSKPDAAALRVRELRGCARDVDDALRDRMKTHDEAGAEAALARVESGQLDDADARAYVADADDAWRAVGVRGLTRAEDHAARARAMVDPAPRIRRQAMRAAQLAKDTSDLEPLTEAARLDPEPMVRTEAIRAIAHLPSHGAFDVANRLRDLWTSADEDLREDIALAWASPDVYPLGGRDALVVLIASGHGPGVIEAAAAMIRDWDHTDRELASSSVALIVRTIDSAPRRGRLHAIAVARLDRGADMLAAVEKASTDDDLHVRVAALSRLTASAPHRAKAIEQLESFAGGARGRASLGDAGTAAHSDPLASRATMALASAGDTRIQSWLEADLTAPDPYERLAAASGLVALGRSARGAPLLADDDPSVRTRAACTLMMAARIHK